jgi:2,3-bisphosphoglycerate-dependent phosphoglycerate mutase
MTVALISGPDMWPVGAGSYFNAFFSTIAALLEPDGWGTRFPHVMRDLYDGEVPVEDIPEARRELEQIRRELSAFPPSAVVWNYQDRSERPPWGDDNSPEITSMGNYFTTSDVGRDLFEVLDEALASAERRVEPVRVEGGL